MALELHDFACLMLAQLALNDSSVSNKPKTKFNVSLPFNYRDCIENILCADNGWKEEFSILIDMTDYFEDHFWWEERLSTEIIKIANRMNKHIEYDLKDERIMLEFDENEISKICSRFSIIELALMNHFVSLVMDSIYSRRHKEEIFDYSARTTAKMHMLYRMSMEQGIGVLN